MTLNIDNSNYKKFKKIIEVIWKYESKYFPKEMLLKSPIEVLYELEKKDMNLARRSLKAGLSDMILSVKEFPNELRNNINDALLDKGLPSLSTLKSLAGNRIKTIIKNKKIKSIDDYYVLKEILDDTTIPISDNERILLSKYFADFEATNHS